MKTNNSVSLITLVCVVGLATCASAQPIEEWCFIEFQDPEARLVGVGGSGFGGRWDYYENTNWYNHWFYDHPLDYQKRKEITIDGMITTTSEFPVWVEVAVNWSTDLYPANPNSPPLPPLSAEREADWIGRQVIFRGEVLPGKTPFGIRNFVLPVPYNPEWVSMDVRPVYAGDDGRTEVRALSFWHECIPEPPTQSQNINFSGALCPGATNPVSSTADSAGNIVELDCNGGFNLYFIDTGPDGIPGTGDEVKCHVATCSYVMGENAAQVQFGGGGLFQKITFWNFEGHYGHKPGNKICDGVDTGYENRDTYVYYPSVNTLEVIKELRLLTRPPAAPGYSDPGNAWIPNFNKPTPTQVLVNYCGPIATPLPDPLVMSNGVYVASLQFLGDIEGGGEVIVTINGVPVAVPTQQGMGVCDLAGQLADEFNRQWGQGQLAQQGKVASQDMDFCQIVRISGAVDEEINVQIFGEPDLEFNRSPRPRCNYAIRGDINQDCKVNFEDFALMAENWLVPLDGIKLNLPDLVPVKAPGNPTFCERSGGDLVVYVKNQGGAEAAGSEVEVKFSVAPGAFQHVRGATGPISSGATDTVYIPIPSGCFDSDCHFTITVDIVNVVQESNEANNSANGTCIG